MLMRNRLAFSVGILLASATSSGTSSARAQASFEFQVALESDTIGDLDSRGVIEGDPGQQFEFRGRVSLVSSGFEGPDPKGPQGWSFGLKNEGVDILAATLRGTVSADVNADPPGLRNGGFQKTEVIDPARNDGTMGMISAVVLSFVLDITLPANDTSLIAINTYRATVGDAEIEASFEFVSGLVGSGQPVDSNVTLDGASVAPTLSRRTLAVRPPTEDCGNGQDDDGDGRVDCDDPDCAQEVVCQAEDCGNGVDDDADGLIDCDDPDCRADARCAGGIDLALDAAGAVFQEAEGVSLLELSPAGDGTSFEVLVRIQPNDPNSPPAIGAQGWSFGIGHDGEVLDVTFPTTRNTVAADVNDDPPGLRNSGFEKTEVVNPAENNGQAGVVSAVVLSFVMNITLDPGQPQEVLRSRYTVRAGQGGPGLNTRISFVDGLRGSGQPVPTVFTVDGVSVSPTRRLPLDVRGAEGPRVEDFIRGDPNDDGRVNIADPIWIINELFRNGRPTTCRDTADATDDGLVDLSDVMFLIEYRFLGGPRPEAPFPDCGGDPTADDIECAVDSFSSCP